jgi:hypothetical protein
MDIEIISWYTDMVIHYYVTMLLGKMDTIRLIVIIVLVSFLLLFYVPYSVMFILQASLR